MNLFRAALRETTFVGSDLTDADLREAELVDVAAVDCDLSSVLFGNRTVRRFDIRGSVLNGSFSLAKAKGFVLSTDQVVQLASVLAHESGATLSDDAVEDSGDLPGGADVAGLVAADPEVGQRGVREARARLGGSSSARQLE